MAAVSSSLHVPFHRRVARHRLVLGMLFVPVVIACALFVNHPFSEDGWMDEAIEYPGWGLIAGGLAFRLWALGHISGRKNKALVTSGPYRRTRNPLYFGSFLYGVGACMIAESLTALLAFMAWFQFLYLATMRSEEENIEEQFGEEFRRYRAAVPFFWPALRPTLPAEAHAFRIKKPWREALTIAFLIFAAWAAADLMERLHFSLSLPSIFS